MSDLSSEEEDEIWGGAADGDGGSDRECAADGGGSSGSEEEDEDEEGGEEGDEAIERRIYRKKVVRTYNAGRRIQNGRLYDSESGVTCHWCRQKTVEDKVYCCLCPNSFCGSCLANRHGEILDEQREEGVQWVCPKCRGGCGPGCQGSCCNCGPCRKARKLPVTGQLKHDAVKQGFNNAHDYLIFLKTGESVRAIAHRKLGKGWISPASTIRYDTEPLFQRKIIRAFSDLDDETPKKRRASDPDGKTPPPTTLRRKAREDDDDDDDDDEDDEEETRSGTRKTKVELFKRDVKTEKEKIDEAETSAGPAKRAKVDESLKKVVSYFTRRVKLERDGCKSQEKGKGKAAAAAAAQETLEQPSKAKTPAAQGRNALLPETTKQSREKDAAGDNSGVNNTENACRNVVRVKIEKDSSAPVAAIVKKELGDSSKAARGMAVAAPDAGELQKDAQQETRNDCTEAGGSGDHHRGSERNREHAAVFRDACADNVTGNSFSHLIDPAARGEGEEEADSDGGSRQTQDSSLTEQQDSDDSDHCEGFIPGQEAGLVYREQLEEELAKPFDAQQLKSMLAEARCKKPVLKYRDTRRGSIRVETNVKAPSYLDHHPDLAEKINAAKADEEKLRLLRGFFFWLMKTCDPGAFRPWVTVPNDTNDDCFVDAPDCQITAVRVALDEQRTAKDLLKQKKASANAAAADAVGAAGPNGLGAVVKKEKLVEKVTPTAAKVVKVKEERMTD